MTERTHRTAGEAAMIWRTSAMQIIHWVRTGELQGYRDERGTYYVEESEVQRYLTAKQAHDARQRLDYLAATVTTSPGVDIEKQQKAIRGSAGGNV